jgi:hypothetical protein
VGSVNFIRKSSPGHSEELFETLPKMVRLANEAGVCVHFDSDAGLP